VKSNTVFVVAWLWIMASVALIILPLVGFDAQVRLYYSNVTMLVTSSLAALICIGAGLGMPKGSPLRKGWLLVGIGIAAWALGQGTFSMYPLLNQGADTPYPYYSDIGFLLSAPLVGAGLLLFYRSAGLETPPWGKVLAVAALVLAAYWCYGANAEGFFSEEGGLPLTLASFGYTVLDPLLLALTIHVAAAFKGGTTMSRAWWTVVAGILIVIAGNQLWSYLVLIEVYQTGSVIDFAWPVGYGLIALSAWLMREAMR
jgi:hypothetical protein